MSQVGPLRLLIVDDHDIVRAGILALLARQPSWTVVAEAADGAEALRLARETQPDVAILDVSLPDLDGITLVRRILDDAPLARVLILSVHDEAPFVQGALRAGACGYVLKERAVVELPTALEALLEGRTYLSPRLLSASRLAPMGTHPSPAAPPLTERQREVLRRLAEGQTVKQIGLALDLSAKTVETHRQHGMERLGLCGIADLVRYAIREGWTSS